MQNALTALVGTFGGVLIGLWVLKEAIIIILTGMLVVLLRGGF